MTAAARAALKAAYAKPHKYRARATIVDGIRFDSAAEAKRYAELKLEAKAKTIISLVLQPRYTLHACDADERPVEVGEYVADFSYGRFINGAWRVVVEDVKSPATMTPLAKWKLRHFAAERGFEVTIIGGQKRRARKAPRKRRAA